MKPYYRDLGKTAPTVNGEWKNDITYEELSIVRVSKTNSSYISKKSVPIGIDINNSEYWQLLCTGSEAVNPSTGEQDYVVEYNAIEDIHEPYEIAEFEITDSSISKNLNDYIRNNINENAFKNVVFKITCNNSGINVVYRCNFFRIENEKLYLSGNLVYSYLDDIMLLFEAEVTDNHIIFTSSYYKLNDIPDKNFFDKVYDALFPINCSISGGAIGNKGQAIDSLSVAWNLIREGKEITPDKVIINNEEVDASLGYKEYTNVSEPTTYNVVVMYQEKQYKGTVYAKFNKPIWFGIMPANSEINNDNINLHFDDNTFKGSKDYATTVTVNNEIIFYAYPKSFGELTSISDGKIEYIHSYNVTELTIDDEIYLVYSLKDPCTVTNYSLIFK